LAAAEIGRLELFKIIGAFAGDCARVLDKTPKSIGFRFLRCYAKEIDPNDFIGLLDECPTHWDVGLRLEEKTAIV
jgi:hypothetical protein